jgi:cell division protein FtsB
MKYGKQAKKSLWKRMRGSAATLVFVAILFVFLARATWNLYSRVDTSAAKLAQAQTELAILKSRESNLARKVGYISTQQGIEAEIRSKFHAVKEGESVAVIIDDKDRTRQNQAAVVGSASTTATTTRSWWRRLFGL